jgi:Probable molybdopterin binding domain
MTTANAPAPNEVAALLVIGDKILSGRTKDGNIGYIAEYLTALGIDLKEVRVVGDEERAIVDALNALRHRHTYVFTTGGIGPTHDDITADSIAKAFGVPIDVDPRALAILHEWLKTHLYGFFPGANGIANATEEQKTQLDHDGTPLLYLTVFGADSKPDPRSPRVLRRRASGEDNGTIVAPATHC